MAACGGKDDKNGADSAAVSPQQDSINAQTASTTVTPAQNLPTATNGSSDLPGNEIESSLDETSYDMNSNFDFDSQQQMTGSNMTYTDDFSGTAVPAPAATSSSSTANVPTTSSAEIDSILDEYEQLVDNCIQMLQDYKNGDNSALNKTQEYLNSITTVQGKIEKINGTFSTAQSKRISDIGEKLSSAISGIQ